MLFTDVYAGEAGSIHDMNLFRRSDLYRRIVNNDAVFYNDSHIIGDLAYKLSTYLMVGFKRNQQLNARQMNYNVTLSKIRAIIENAYALLKGRFRRLKYLETVRLDLVSLLIVSACILHNICILNGDMLRDTVNLEAETADIRALDPQNALDIDDEVNMNIAVIKRSNIVTSLRTQNKTMTQFDGNCIDS